MSNLTDHRDDRFPLAQLCQVAGDLLGRASAPSDDRVRALPDARTVRYYQSTGLLDRPLTYEGRRAIYGYRHLLQLLSVKLLQIDGMPLSRIQTGLAGRTDAQMEAAVLQALAPELTPPPPAHRALTSVELRPGVVVTVDPALVPDPDALFDALGRALDAL